MSDSKFKPGDVCWHVTQGVVKLGRNLDHDSDKFPLCRADINHDVFREDGTEYEGQPFPTLLTLDEARARGFPVPKERLRVGCRVRWSFNNTGFGGVIYPTCLDEPRPDLSSLVGRTGVLVFTEDEGETK